MAFKRESVEKEINTGTSGLTLLRMRAWMQEPIERSGKALNFQHFTYMLSGGWQSQEDEYCRMCLMARLCDSCGPLRGGALASRLHCHAIHGDIQSTAVLVHRYNTSPMNIKLAYLPSHRCLIVVSGSWTPSARPYTPWSPSKYLPSIFHFCILKKYSHRSTTGALNPIYLTYCLRIHINL